MIKHPNPDTKADRITVQYVKPAEALDLILHLFLKDGERLEHK